MSPNAQLAVAAGRGPIVVLLLRLRGGTVYAFGTEACEIEQRGIDTASIQVSPGLIVDEMESAIDPFALAGETALTQAQVSIVLPESAAAMQGDWRYFGAATAELARVWPGDVWRDREAMLVGTRLSGVTLGIAGMPSSFTIEAARAKTSAVIGDASRTIGADFPTPIDVATNALTSLEGVEYPSVHGAPYRSAGFKIGQIGGDGYDRVVIAGHDFADLGTVTAYGDGASLGTFAVLNTTATSGPYAYIRSNAAAFDNVAITIAPARGGVARVAGDAAALTFGDLLELWLNVSGLAVNWTKMRPTIERLRSWPGGVYLDTATSAIEAIRDHLVSVAPLIEMQSAEGMWFYLADFSTIQLRGVLTEGQELVGYVDGMQLTEADDLVNSVTIRYSFDEFTGEYAASEVVGPDTDTVALVSDQMYGAYVADPIESSAIKDASTARRAGRSLIHRQATRRRVTTWLVSDTTDITPGEVYRVVSATWGIDAPAVVTSIVGVVGRVVTFTVLDGPLAT